MRRSNCVVQITLIISGDGSLRPDDHLALITWPWSSELNPTIHRSLTLSLIEARIKTSNFTGYDGYNTKFIKLSTSLLAPALVKIFNLAINTGVYPNSLKIAKVIPIFKSGSKTSVNNYRPISILSTFDKIFEKIIYSRLVNYIDKFKLLYKYQFGFRKKTLYWACPYRTYCSN